MRQIFAARGFASPLARPLLTHPLDFQTRSLTMSRINMTPGNFTDVTSNAAVGQLNSLLRGEISACETYRMAIDKVADSDQISMDNASILREIEREHGI